MYSRNVGVIAGVWGALSLGTGLLCALNALVAVAFGEWGMVEAFLLSTLVCAAGGGLWLAGRAFPGRDVSTRDAIFIVATGWALVSCLGALPFLFSGELGLVDSLFESVSGYTTTGSSVMRELDHAPRSLCLWRSTTHWTGGMGIILLLIAILPYLGVGGKLLLLRESTGPVPKGIEPKAHETAMRLFIIYVALTAIGIGLYVVAGMGFFDAVNHAFSAISTGGFSTSYNSIASFESWPIELVTIAVMLAGGVNFLMYYKLTTRDWRVPLYDTELRVFLGIFVVASLLVAINLSGFHGGNPNAPEAVSPDFSAALRAATFEVATMMTDCGFVLANYDEWPVFSQLMLFLVTMIGGCVGSTAGGFKILRLVIVVHVIYNWLERSCRPKLVQAVRVNDVIMGESTIYRVLQFLALYTAWMTFGIFFMSLTGLPVEAAVTSVIATMNNCGPGLGAVGPTTDFSEVHVVGKLFLILNMLVGRLELVTFLALFLPSFWHRD